MPDDRKVPTSVRLMSPAPLWVRVLFRPDRSVGRMLSRHTGFDTELVV